jgi:hypothetical protein
MCHTVQTNVSTVCLLFQIGFDVCVKVMNISVVYLRILTAHIYVNNIKSITTGQFSVCQERGRRMITIMYVLSATDILANHKRHYRYELPVHVIFQPTAFQCSRLGSNNNSIAWVTTYCLLISWTILTSPPWSSDLVVPACIIRNEGGHFGM